MFRFILILTSVNLIYATGFCQADIPFSKKMAESVMISRPNRYGSWNYETGTVLKGFEDLWRTTDDITYYNYIKATVDYVVNSSGIISGYNKTEYNLDQVREGCNILFLYDQTGAAKYKTAADSLRSQLATHPRNNAGGFYHKLIYPYQMWLDGLYMAEPFYCQYAKMMNEPADNDDIALQFKLMENHGRDSRTGLLRHGWDESKTQYWANPVTGQSPVVWGRSVGWYAMALVDVLDSFPESADRDSIIMIFQRLAFAIKDFQDPESHVWWQVVDSINGAGNWKESSGSCMFVYALAKGIRMHYIDSSYMQVVKDGFGGLINEFVTYNTNGTMNLTNTCEGTGVGGSYAFYIGRGKRTNDPKGVGPFIMAAVEVEKAGLLVQPDIFILDSLNADAAYLSWKDNSQNEKGFLLERNDGQGFTQIADIKNNITFYIDSAQVEGSSYEYRIRTYNDSDSSIYSSVLKVNSIPSKATGFVPSDGSEDIETNVSLSWHPGRIIESHCIYFGTTNPPPYLKNTTDTIYTPGSLNQGTTYYWRIDEVGERYTRTGDIMSFKTIKNPTGKVQLNEKSPDIKIYPNPAGDILNIEYHNFPDSGIEVFIYNTSGEVMICQKSDNLNTSLNLNNLKEGLYILKITGAVSGIIYRGSFQKGNTL